jgi:hypothetical protein
MESQVKALTRKRWFSLLCLLGVALATACRRPQTSADIHVHGPTVAPQLEFACCEYSIDETQKLFSDPSVIEALKQLHATVAIPTNDLSPQRADAVRLLNHHGIPVIAWIVLPREQGYYLTADNFPAAATRIADFNKWTRDNDLQWRAVGLDIEPNVAELSQLRGHRWRLAATLLRRSLNGARIRRAQKAYYSLVDQIRTLGYPVQIYQMPYIPAERSAHSTLPDRLLGTVDVRGDEDYLMLYTNNVRAVGAGMIWSLGPQAWGIGIGDTDANGTPGAGTGPLDWNEFSRDLIVASHFTPHVGIYNLEGCVRQGFLPRLLTFDWSQTATIPAASVERARRLGIVSRSTLWILSNLIYLLLAAIIIAIGWRWWHRRSRSQRG